MSGASCMATACRAAGSPHDPRLDRVGPWVVDSRRACGYADGAMSPDTQFIWSLTTTGPFGRRWRLRLALALHLVRLRRTALWVAGPHA